MASYKTTSILETKGDSISGFSVSKQLSGQLSILKDLFTGDYLNASGGYGYSNKNFGRDSAISMLFLLNYLDNAEDGRIRQQTQFIIEKGITSLVYWQGVKGPKLGRSWRKNAEEPGRIHHEAGPVAIDKIGLVRKWQDDDDKNSDMLVYFGSVDSTPLFVVLVCRYLQKLNQLQPNGSASRRFLNTEVSNFRGGQRTIGYSLLEAIGWIEQRLQKSELGLIEYYRNRSQEEGLINQVWKDSRTAFVHTDGKLANDKKPVASIEVQALAFDALTEAADLFSANPRLARDIMLSDRQIVNWRIDAKTFRQRIFSYFWLEEQGRFVQAIDRQPATGFIRQIETPSSNELHLLNSRLFDGLDQSEKAKYLTSLVNQCFSEEFLTDVGIRCRAKSYHHLINFSDYHGSWAVWPWETHWIALGLRRQGLKRLADQLDKRITNAFKLSEDYAEFYLVNPHTNTSYYRFITVDHHDWREVSENPLVATNVPDMPQTWSATAAININGLFEAKHGEASMSEWLYQLQQELLTGIEAVKLINRDEQLHELRQQAHTAVVDLAGGKNADDHYHYSSLKNSKLLLPKDLVSSIFNRLPFSDSI